MFFYRRILKSLSDEEYHDVLTFCSNFPRLSMTIETEGKRPHPNDHTHIDFFYST